MKSSVTAPAPTFQPVTVTLTFETQDELDRFAALANHPTVTDHLQALPEDLWNKLQEAGASLEAYYELASEWIKFQP